MPAQDARAGYSGPLRVELDPPSAAGHRLGTDGTYVELASVEPGQTFTLTEPLPVSFGPAALLLR